MKACRARLKKRVCSIDSCLNPKVFSVTKNSYFAPSISNTVSVTLILTLYFPLAQHHHQSLHMMTDKFLNNHNQKPTSQKLLIIIQCIVWWGQGHGFTKIYRFYNTAWFCIILYLNLYKNEERIPWINNFIDTNSLSKVYFNRPVYHSIRFLVLPTTDI